MTAAPIVKGWCPGAYRPMMSGDGLIVRVRPRMSRLTAPEADRLAGLSERYGNGIIDLTSRGNLQLRGVDEAQHEALLAGLLEAGLLDDTPQREAKRNILVAPFDDGDGMASRVHEQIIAHLDDLPDLPAKMGLVLDTGLHRCLPEAPADFRIETGAQARLILRADGADTGVVVDADTALPAVLDMARWFVDSGGRAAGRMGRHLRVGKLPQEFQGHLPAVTGPRPAPGPRGEGFLLGAAFGAIEARALRDVLQASAATGLRVTPWRMLLLEGVTQVKDARFVTAPGDALLAVHACPGAPMCPQAGADTRPLARALAKRVDSTVRVHVSGCAKGCAHPKSADLTFVGSGGKFDLVREGAAWEEPDARGLTYDAILKDVVKQ